MYELRANVAPLKDQPSPVPRDGSTTFRQIYRSLEPKRHRGQWQRTAQIYFAGCLAITLSAIFLYVASGIIFFLTRSVLDLYGRPSMIFCE